VVAQSPSWAGRTWLQMIQDVTAARALQTVPVNWADVKAAANQNQEMEI